ncbi:MAG: hypothetical protein L0Z54_01235, partial [Thermoplasmata archaeon]|nr:hypothetical protein [Thermoplasmata archaeon]
LQTPARRYGLPIGLALFAGSWALVPRLGDLSALALLLLAQQAGVAMMALSATSRGRRPPSDMTIAVALSTLIFLGMAFYTTPVIADVYIFRLDYNMNYILYHHAHLFLALSGAIAAAAAFDAFILERIVSRVAPAARER